MMRETLCGHACRLWVSCIAGFFFLLVFAVLRGKIQVYSARMVRDLWQIALHMHCATMQPGVGLMKATELDACDHRISPARGRSLLSCQWAVYTTSGAAQCAADLFDRNMKVKGHADILRGATSCAGRG